MEVGIGGVESLHEITGDHMNQDAMTAMFRVIVGVVACEIRYAKADYQCELAMTAAVKHYAVIQDVNAQTRD